MFCALISVSAQASLVSMAEVNVTSDTATNAKNMAFDEARRQIIIDVLSPYSDTDSLHTLVKEEKQTVLTNLISSSSITGERSSDTTYSASITMTVDAILAKKWLDMHGVQNWVPTGPVAQNNFTVVAILNDKIGEWMNLRRAVTGAGIELNTTMIFGDEMNFAIPVSKRSAFTLAIRDAGWYYADDQGVLKIHR